MCEWLSCGEWCDVYLQCSGRVFSAHRAVLASVSNFLREALLSCPQEETPIMIVLPDFEHNSLSSVLYYIYNGEVIIKKSQLKMFLEIINAMQIYIDSQYLTNITDLIESDDVNTHCQHLHLRTSTRVLRDDNDNNEYINLSTNVNLQKVFSQAQNSFENKYFTKDIAQSERRVNESFSDYLKSVHEYRQRQSFSRGLFIETCSLNGNSNGESNDVLAITNEHYREPTSPHFTNANSGYLGTNNLLTKSSIIKVSEHISKLKFDQQDNKKYNMFRIKKMFDRSGLRDDNEAERDLNVLCMRRAISERKEDEGGGCMLDQSNFKIYSITECDTNVNYTNFPSDKKSSMIYDGKSNHHKTSYSRAAILNEVMQSPWKAKVPNNYRPSSKISTSIAGYSNADYVCKVDTLSKNDSNNNTASSFVSMSKLCNEKKQDNGDVCECLKCSNFANTECKPLTKQCSRYKCVECHKSFSQLRNYKYHMSIHRGTKEFAATCPICGKYFNDKGYLSSHMKIHRNRKEYKCSICPKSFNQRVAYNMHMRIHTGVKPHVCEECGKAFSRKMLLKQHFRTHSGERPYACSHCDKRFADRSNMTLHLRLHTGVKPFKCSLCPKSFTKKHHLKSHLNFHTGDKPYSCPRCKLAFTQSSNMRTHYKKCNMTIIEN